MSLLLNSVLQNSELQLCLGHTTETNDTDYELYDKAKLKNTISLFDKHFIVDKNIWIVDSVLKQFPEIGSHYLVDNKVYLCIQNNNNAVSTVKPTGTSIFNYQTSDGYVWRYLFTVQLDDHIDYIRVSTNISKPPVKNAIARPKDYDLSTLTFNSKPFVQVVSKSGLGAVIELDYTNKKASNLRVVSGGSHYHPNDYILVSENVTGNDASIDYSIVDGSIVINSFVAGGNYISPVVHVIGDGTGAIIDSNVVAGSFESITVTSGGSNYTWAKLIIAPSINSFVTKIILESPNGFGYEPRVDIINSSLMVSKTFNVDVDTNINFIMLTSKTLTNEYPNIYTVNNINNKILSNNSDNLIQVIIDEAI